MKTQLLTLSVVAALTLFGCGQGDGDSTESELFSAVENGSEAVSSSAAYSVVSSATNFAGREGEKDEFRRGHRDRFRRFGHFMRFAHRLWDADPSVRGAIGLSLRNPLESEDAVDEEDFERELPETCQVDLTLQSNLVLKVEREPRKLEEAGAASVSEDGHSVVIQRSARRTRMLVSLNDGEETVETPTLTLQGTITCASATVNVNVDLSSKLAPSSKPIFKYHDEIDGALLRTIGVMFPKTSSEEENEADL